MKKILSIILAVALVLSTLTTPALASSGGYGAVPIYIGNAEVDYLADQILQEIPTSGLSSREQIRAVYDWVINHCQRYEWDGKYYFDEATVRAQSQGYEHSVNDGRAVKRLEMEKYWNISSPIYYDPDSNYIVAQFAYDMMHTRTGNCLHYSALLAVLLGHLGYDCRIVWGDFINNGGSMVEHVWNYILVDGQYYWFDVRMDHASISWRGYIPYDYFMVSDTKEWEKTHSWDHTYTNMLAANPRTVIQLYNQSLGYEEQSMVGGFIDVFESDNYAAAVAWAVEHGVTNGTGDGLFSPHNAVSRAEAVTFLWRTRGKPAPAGIATPFQDVDYSSWYGEAVQWAVEQGITNGTGDGLFSPWATLTQNQMVTLLYRTLGEPGKTGNGEWYEDAERWAQGEGLLEETYCGESYCPRCDVVSYLYRLFGR